MITPKITPTLRDIKVALAASGHNYTGIGYNDPRQSNGQRAGGRVKLLVRGISPDKLKATEELLEKMHPACSFDVVEKLVDGRGGSWSSGRNYTAIYYRYNEA